MALSPLYREDDLLNLRAWKYFKSWYHRKLAHNHCFSDNKTNSIFSRSPPFILS